MAAASCRLIMRGIELQPSPLYNAIYKYDFQRGPLLPDGASFFVGEDISSPLQFSVIGEVESICLHDDFATLFLGQPQACGSAIDLVWRQQISALERIELEDGAVDVKRCAVSDLILSSCSFY
jgi:hypothetical protein